jgi:hypothetical protein
MRMAGLGDASALVAVSGQALIPTLQKLNKKVWITYKMRTSQPE